MCLFKGKKQRIRRRRDGGSYSGPTTAQYALQLPRNGHMAKSSPYVVVNNLNKLPSIKVHIFNQHSFQSQVYQHFFGGYH